MISKSQALGVPAEFVGRHNQNIETTFSRLTKGHSWKKTRIVVFVPAAATFSGKVYLSHTSLIYPPNQPVYRHLCEGEEVGVAYSNGIEAVLSHPELSTWEYLLTIEHDNLPPPDGVLGLIRSMEEHPELSCIGGLYYTKGEGGVAQIWGDPNDPVVNFRPQPPRPGEVQECCGTGMGFNLWRMSVFKDRKLRKPWFVTQKNDGVATQDLYFWADAKKHGLRCAIDCSVKVGHLDTSTGVVW